MQKTILACGLAALSITTNAVADDLFSLTAEGSGISASGGGSNVVDLVADLIDSEADFASLDNTAFTASLRYGELNDAILVTRNGAGTSATLTIPSTGFTRTFTAANQNELEDQIENFLKEDGADAYAEFLREIGRQTSLGVNDGNPLATTALLADLGYYRFGFRQRIPGDAPIRLARGWDLRLHGGVSETDIADGWFAGLTLGKNWRLSDRVGITLASAFRYRDVESASIYQTGSVLALPIAIIPAREEENKISWHVTPAFVNGFGGSWDLAAGGVLIGGQITSSLALRTGGWTFVLANQFGFYEGLPIDISDFRFETDTSQQILKNGVQLIRDVSDDAYFDLGANYTNLLEDAFIEDYVSAEAGLTFRTGKSSGLRLGYHGDFNDDFNTHGGNVSWFFSY